MSSSPIDDSNNINPIDLNPKNDSKKTADQQKRAATRQALKAKLDLLNKKSKEKPKKSSVVDGYMKNMTNADYLESLANARADDVM